jgi:hypothetical protein
VKCRGSGGAETILSPGSDGASFATSATTSITTSKRFDCVDAELDDRGEPRQQRRGIRADN